MARLYSTRKRVLVTGGACVLGSDLIDRLLAWSMMLISAMRTKAAADRAVQRLSRTTKRCGLRLTGLRCTRGTFRIWLSMRNRSHSVATRSFCYVDDLFDGLIRLMNSPSSFTGLVNLRNPTEFTMRELANLVLAEMGPASKLVNQPLPPDDPKQRQRNTELGKKHSDWSPSISLSEGPRPTVAYFCSLD